jgi:hypothetical protein
MEPPKDSTTSTAGKDERIEVVDEWTGFHAIIFQDAMECPEVRTLHPAAFRLWVYLKTWTTRGVASPSQLVMSKRLKIPLRTVKRAVAELERALLLRRERHSTRGRSVVYRMLRPPSFGKRS